MTTSKVIKIVAAVGVVALLSYGGLAWWQLNQFDRRVGEHRYISSPLYDGEIQVEKAFLKRNVQLTAGIDTDGQQPGQHSVAAHRFRWCVDPRSSPHTEADTNPN